MSAAAPVQIRSRQRLEDILEAAEALLEQRAFEDIAVGDILVRSGSSTGSFYARFASKDELLPALYERYHSDLPRRVERLRKALTAADPGLRSVCDRVVGEFAAFFEGRINLMRALTIYARTRPEILRPLMPERSAIQREIVELFRPHYAAVRHPEPDKAVALGLLFVSGIVREAVLFPHAPFASATGQSLGAVKPAAAHMLFSYLTTNPD